MGLLIVGLGCTHLGGGHTPFALAPPSLFNDWFLCCIHSFARHRDSLSGFVHSCQWWSSSPQLKQWLHLLASFTVFTTAT